MKTVLYDSGRFPLLFRLPALGFGIFALWLAVGIACYGLFGVEFGPFPMAGSSGSTILGALACFIIAALWIFVWFAQMQILFDPTRQELIVRSRGYLRSHERRVNLTGASHIQVGCVSGGITGRKRQVRVEYSDGRREWLADIPSGVDSFAELLRSATKLPVTKHGEPA